MGAGLPAIRKKKHCTPWGIKTLRPPEAKGERLPRYLRKTIRSTQDPHKAVREKRGTRAACPLSSCLGEKNLCAGRGRNRFWLIGRFCLVLRLMLSLMFLVLSLCCSHLHAALDHGAIFHADAGSDYVPGETAFGADIQAVAALNIALDLAHDNHFAGDDIGCHSAIAANGDTVVGQVDGTLD